MAEHQSTRTLVKSAPELWTECSDAASLARHLGADGEIRITRLEPETTVAWEGAAVCGTVRLEPSGWGTKVTLTMSEDESVRGPAPAPVAAAPEPLPAAVAPRRAGLLARLLRRRHPLEAPAGGEPVAPEPMPVARSAEPVAQPPDPPPASREDALAAALDSLGRAHHRPYSRG